jgi:BNR repeat-containing family member
MRRWSRPIGISVSVGFMAVLLVVALRSGEPSEPIPRADLRNGRVFIQDNLWSTETHQYGVWVAPDGTPYAGRRRRGTPHWETVNLSKVAGNALAAPTENDQHNVYSIALDAAGGVHVAGNMHNDPLRYVRSPSGDLSRWTNVPPPTAGEYVTYPAFVGLRDGTLLFWHREGIAGYGAIVLEALDPGATAWRSLGTVLDGRPSGEGPYIHHVAQDPRSWTIHLLFEWRAGRTTATNSDVGYARSDDGGRTWETSTGTPLRLPITHATAETVIDTLPAGTGLLNAGGLTVDARGQPHGVVTFSGRGGEKTFEHIWLDDGGWHREQLDDLFFDGRAQIVGMPDGRVWLLGVRGGMAEAVDVSTDRERLETRELAQVPVGWEVSYDSQALARFGRVEMLIPDGDRPQVVEADLTP